MIPSFHDHGRTADERSRPASDEAHLRLEQAARGGLEIPLQGPGARGKGFTLGKWEELPGAGVELLTSIGVKTSLGQRAYLLIRRALTAAGHELVGESVAQFRRVDDDVEDLVESFDWSLEEAQLQIDRNFFDRPADLSIVGLLQERLTNLLVGFGLDPARASRVANRLGTYLTFHLAREWREHPAAYGPLEEALEGPFSEAAEREQGWWLYDAWLQKRAAEPVFGESFSIEDVYIPLRGYWRRTSRSGKGDDAMAIDAPADRRLDVDSPRGGSPEKRIAVRLHDEIESWLDKAKATTWVRLLSGGPGSGKSTFARVLSARVSRAGDRKVLYVPLHQLDISADLVTAVERFVGRNRFLTANPLDPKSGEPRLFLVLDGLDELAMQGKVGTEVASDFVGEVRRTVDHLNGQGSDIRVLITGRPVAVDPQGSHFRKPGQLLHALPYQVPESERKRYDDQELVEEDQRELWWTRYGECVGAGHEGLPDELAREDLAEITRQPLLNYLLALSYERGRVDFSRETSLNQIYADLLDAVYERRWGPGGPHPAVGDLTIDDFRRVLEEIAVTAWHGNGRTASMHEIDARFRRIGLEALLERFAGGAEAGIGRLLLAFYFRRAGRRETGDATFEFTHKSFGEYLVARRIVGMIGTIARQREARKDDFETGWDERRALEKWAELTGPTALEMNLLGFLRREVALRDEEGEGQARRWQTHLAALLSRELAAGLPMERIEPRLTTYHQMTRCARNAEEALLAALNACARASDERIAIEWPSHTSLGDLICRLRRQRTGPSVLALDCLSYLKADLATLHIADLYGADLCGASLEHAVGNHPCLIQARLRGSSLKGAILSAGYLQGAELREADLRGARLWEADLRRAGLRKADFGDTEFDLNEFEERFLGTRLFRRQLDGLELPAEAVETIRQVAELSEED